MEPLRFEFDVECSPAHAFAVWTERLHQWWPPGHTVSGNPAEIVLEPWVGGRFLERTTDGRDVVWGEVTVWAPPDRLEYLWHIRRDRADATDVAITFAETDAGNTRVAIVHSGWDRLADGPTWRDANVGGWTGVLPHFVTACRPRPERDEEHL